jgi:hypothetical protein
LESQFLAGNALKYTIHKSAFIQLNIKIFINQEKNFTFGIDVKKGENKAPTGFA